MREYAGTQLNGNTLLSSVKYNYEDKTNRLSAIVRNSLLGTQEISFVYGNLTAKQNPDAVYTVKHNGTPVLNYNYDPLGRLLTRTIAPINKTQSFTYKQGGHGANSTSALVETVTVNGETKRYTYDANGNIIMVQTNDALECQYQYNSKNELVLYEIQDGINTYNYDNNGNITSAVLWDDTVKTFSYTDPNWPDKLTAVNGCQICYDAIGNPISYYDNNLMDWDNGRQLVGILDTDVEYNYAYDANGLRIYKEIDCTTTQFHYADGVLLGQTTEDDTLTFLYDESGNKFGFIYNGAYYYYDINLQGDVVGIYNSNGVKVVTYEYDPWGVITNITDTSGIDIGTINPIRYRGYYYDNETGFYYLQSRYYDPGICRFISADSQIAGVGGNVLGYNQFAYCFNNPVNMSDDTGNWPKWSRIKQRVKSFFLDFISDYGEVSASEVIYDVPLYNQGLTNLCWANSQTMIDSYKNDKVLTKKEAKAYAKQLAVDLHGKEQWNQGGSPQTKKSIITAEQITDINVLYKILKDNGPVYARYANENNGHAIVITGVSLFSNMVFTNNPWGIRGKQTFEDFKDGFVPMWYSGPANMTLDRIYILE